MEPNSPIQEDSFVGTQKVLEFTSRENSDLVDYSLDNGRKDVVTMGQFLAMISPTPYPDGEISVRQWKPMVDGVMDLFLANNLRLIDKDFVLGQIEDRLITAANKADEKLWKVAHKMHVGIRQIDEVLKQTETEIKTEETPPTE